MIGHLLAGEPGNPVVNSVQVWRPEIQGAASVSPRVQRPENQKFDVLR